ncbi:hypothetical protein BGZ94_008322 [Podila epigama]|nr:hypothetical protein BGZ94_008322 [Podila epigama]
MVPEDKALFKTLLLRAAQHASEKHDSSSQDSVLPAKPFPSSTDEHSVDDAAIRSFLSLAIQDDGVGLGPMADELFSIIAPSISNSAGPRYFGLVTGGATPAAFVADWVVTTYDQNACMYTPEAISGFSVIDEQAMRMVVDLFRLPRHYVPAEAPSSKDVQHQVVEPSQGFKAITTSGSTGSNIVGMAAGRQWVGMEKFGVDYSQDGYDGRVVVITNMAHASVWKAASILGIGRKQVVEISGLGSTPSTEELENEILRLEGQGKAAMVFLSFGEVNTGIFPSYSRQVGEACRKHRVYLHIDGAFGIYARCSPLYEHLADGLELAHSITACGHKWLNVPYDCGLFLYQQGLESKTLTPVFSSTAAYLQANQGDAHPHPLNISIENSRRFRALPVWATLRAYGRAGYEAIVNENCRFAKTMFEWMKHTRPDLYTVLEDECPLNIVVFAKTTKATSDQEGGKTSEQRLAEVNKALLENLNNSGVAYFSPTVWKGRPAIRAAISNWRTQVDRDWPVVRSMLEEQGSKDLNL